METHKEDEEDFCDDEGFGLGVFEGDFEGEEEEDSEDDDSNDEMAA